MIGFLGGTGPEGRGLALRFAMGGHQVLLGSRDPARAEAAAQDVAARFPGLDVAGAHNSEVARRADPVFITVPYQGHRETLESLKEALEGKTLVDVVSPITFVAGRARALPVEAGSVAQQTQQTLPRARVVAAFHGISAVELLVPDRVVECDVVVCSDDAEAKRQIMSLAEAIPGVRAVDGNGLECARYVEELTALLLNINRIYKGRSMIKIVGI